MSHAAFRGIRRGRILAAPTDFPIMQGKLAIEMAVRAIEGPLETRHAGPRIQLVTPDMVGNTNLAETLAPASFIPVFELDEHATCSHDGDRVGRRGRSRDQSGQRGAKRPDC